MSSGFRVWGFRVPGRIHKGFYRGFGVRVEGLGFRVGSLGFWCLFVP